MGITCSSTFILVTLLCWMRRLSHVGVAPELPRDRQLLPDQVLLGNLGGAEVC
jgi:hypothetical protein